MQTVPLSEAKDKLSALVETVEREHEIIQITRHGRGAAVLISQDDLDSLRETVYWLSQPGIRDDIANARREAKAGQTVGADELRARFGLSST
jgi:antitoxin YefM